MLKSLLKKTKLYTIYLQRGYKQSDQQKYSLALELRSEFVDQFIPKQAVGAELGVLKGNFSKVLINIAKPKKLHLVDPWYLLGPIWSWADGNQSTVDAVIKVFREHKAKIEQGQVEIHIADDRNFLAELPEAYLDWVYIDSSHTYSHTLEELELLKQIVKKTGVITGDDWHSDVNHKHYGVAKAVKEFVERNDYEIRYANSDNLQWAISIKD